MEWTGAVYADAPTVEVSTWIAAAPEKVWALASDINVMADCSPELERVEWNEGYDKPCVGARFTGYNKHAALGEWSTVSEVVECDPQRAFAWVVGDVDHPTATWRFRMTPEGTGTRLSQWAQLGPAPSGLSIAIAAMPGKEQKIVFNRLREFESGMSANLEHIKNKAEA
ncbi:SRPBCC family protein [Mycobacterium sp. OTB74]|uniref:SRPBCC family protein n=1 Tax=Mycobacterium sp. OTB74 TaxID=1853452 RepID=UPI002475FC1B|nr:SRPBCC family protein [Mycobacterium sp. OTB74]MDH6244090.1 ligand-binding SRPBCC domain-containing protein [Mycobacterium sp. OTB74]